MAPPARSIERHAAVLGKLTDFTVSMWIQYDGGPSRQLFTFSDGTLSHRVQMEVHNGTLEFGWQDGPSFQFLFTAPLEWESGRWYHVVFTNSVREGRSILRSNDLVWKTDPNTLSPAKLGSPVTRAQIGSLNGAYPFNGCIDDVRLFDSARPLSEQLALYDASKSEPDDPRHVAVRTAMLESHRRVEMARRARRLFYEEEAPHLSKSELQRKVEWLFQTEEDDLFTRAGKEIVWTGEMIDRLQNRLDAPELSDESAALNQIEQRASAEEAAQTGSPGSRTWDAKRQEAFSVTTRNHSLLRPNAQVREPGLPDHRLLPRDAMVGPQPDDEVRGR